MADSRPSKTLGPRQKPGRPAPRRSQKKWSGMPLAAQIAARGSILMLGILGAVAVFVHIDRLPEGDKPWGEARLDEPIGRFSYDHIAALRGDPVACYAALDGSDMNYTPMEPRAPRSGSACGWDAAVQVTQSNLDYATPEPEVASCALAAALYVWEREVVRPAALEHLGSDVVEIVHYGTFACRRVNNSQAGSWSEHAGANAIDVAGFRLADGREVGVRHWDRDDERAAFLRAVRDGSCPLFRGVLGPDYNAAHADHFHLDMGEWEICS